MPSGGKILIIDDEDVVLDSCTQILEGRGYDLATAQGGAAGLERLEGFAPDLVFVDLKMPGLSGLEVLERIRTHDATIVPIVITGYATVSSAVDAMKKGAFDFLPKPFTPEELRLITQRGMEKRRLVLETARLRREKEVLRENFAAIVSHELKSPLGALQQNLYALAAELEDKLSADQQARLDRLQGRLADLLKLIHTWLRVFSVDISKIRDSFGPLAMDGPIAKAIESVQPHAQRKDITLVTSVSTPLSPVNGDDGSLTEALVNVFGNAVKYSPAGGRVAVTASEQNTDVVVTVVDTGVGIAPEDLPFVFEDFYRGRTGARSGEGGLGLGLAITRRIIEAHDGTISAASEPGKGSTFVIRLPILKSHAQM